MKNLFSIKYLNLTICILASIALLSVSCTKKTTVTPTVATLSPGQGAGSALVTLQGSGLSNIVSATFDNGNVPVAFNPNFNTDKAIIFTVPPAANVGPQHVIFTNAAGYQFSVPFTVLAIPTLISAFPTDWEAGNTITITGNYLQTTTHVGFAASADTATILSATATQLVLKMPASSVTSTKLIVTNDAGPSTSQFSLINMDQQLKFFTEAYGPGMQDWSWDNSSVSTDFAVSGVTSLKQVFSAGGGQGQSFHNDNVMVLGNYSFLSLWIKGGSADNTLNVFPDAIAAGSAGGVNVSVPANVWSHITIPMSSYTGVSCQRFDFQISGPATAQTLYFDNVILVNP
jgi:hypothetical protein